MTAFQGAYGGGDSDAFVTQIHISPVTLSPISLTFSSQLVGTTSGSKQIQAKNNGSLPLNITGVTITGPNAGDFLQTNNCSNTLNAGQSCAINVAYAPTATGSSTATVNVATDASGSPPQTASLSGTAVAPVASLSPTSLDFGAQTVNTTSAPQTVTLSNTGNATLSNINISISGGNNLDFAQTNNCPASLGSNSSCSINVTFTPTATGNRSSTVAISDNAAGSPQIVNLSGTGTNATVSLSPTSVTFGNQPVSTTSAAQTVTLANTGGSAVTISSIAITGTNSGDFGQTNNCPSSLASNSSCAVNVTFTPTATGSRSAALTVTDSATGSPQAASLTGVGTAPAVTLNPASLTFGNQQVSTTSAAQAVTLTNNGSSALTITSISITGTNSGDFAQTNNCPLSPSTLAASASCAISVTFRPTAAGTRSGTLSVADNAAGSPQGVGLSGTGVAPASGSVSPTSLSFGDQRVNTSSTKAVTLSNTGGSELSNINISITGANSNQFSQTNNCGASLAAGSSCTINVTFRPTTTGSMTATVTVADNASNSPQTVSLTGAGVQPVASVSPTSVLFLLPQLVGTTSAPQTVTLSNTGSGTLTISSIAISGGNSGDFAQTNNCGGSVAAGARCSISVTFSPTGILVRSSTLVIQDNASGSPQEVSLTGTGL